MSTVERRNGRSLPTYAWVNTGRCQTGFTMIELIVVMVVLAAMLTLGSSFIVSPFRIAQDVNRRAELVDVAHTAISRMAREIRRALPNSIRLLAPNADGRSDTVEFLLTRSGGRYRRQPDTTGVPTGDLLDLNAVAGQFDILGGLPDFASIDTSGSCALGTADCLVVYNTDAQNPASPTNAYGGLNRADIMAVSAGSLSYANAGGGLGLPTHSPNQRFHVIEGPVSFRCTGNELRRHDGYPIQPVQSGAVSIIGAGSLLADQVSACEFRYRPGDASRNGLLSIRLELSVEGETVSLLQQVHVMNAP